MINLKIDNHKITLPGSSEEITARMYYDYIQVLTDDNSRVERFAKITGLDIDIVKGLKDVKTYLKVLEEFQTLVADVDVNQTKAGSTIQVGDYSFKVPEDVAIRRVDLFEFCALLLRNNTEALAKNDLPKIIEIYVQILAHYVQASMTNYNDYDPEQAHYLIEKIWNCKAQDVFGFGNFFFVNFAESLTGTKKESSTFLTRLRNWILDLLKWLKIGAS